MCLEIKSTEASDLFGDKEKITCWKVIASSGFSVFMGTKYHLGENISNRALPKLQSYEKSSKIIDNGIHVFTKKAFAVSDRCGSEIIVTVTCYKKDFIAIGEYGDAVFNKVYLSRRQVAKFRKQEDI